MKALSKFRSAAGGAAAKLSAGASKLRRGPGAAWRSLAGAFRWAAGGVRDAVRDAAGWAWARSGVPRLIAAARSKPGVAIAWAAGTLLVCAWIGWAVYTSVEHGAMAGLGVLLSWPVALGALAIIAAPFVAAALLIRRRRDGDPPAIAGGAEVAADPADGEAVIGGTDPG